MKIVLYVYNIDALYSLLYDKAYSSVHNICNLSFVLL